MSGTPGTTPHPARHVKETSWCVLWRLDSSESGVGRTGGHGMLAAPADPRHVPSPVPPSSLALPAMSGDVSCSCRISWHLEGGGHRRPRNTRHARRPRS